MLANHEFNTIAETKSDHNLVPEQNVANASIKNEKV